MQKTIIQYRRVKKTPDSIQALPKLGIDEWIMCGVDTEVFYFYKKITKKIEKKLTKNEAAFEKFWEKYPRKIAKAKCETIFMQFDDKIFDSLFAGLDLYLKSWKKYIVSKNLEYIPHPQTWLNQERWTDEIEMPDESKNLLNIDRAKKEAEEARKKEALEKAEHEEARKKIDDKILELQNTDPGRLERIREAMQQKVRDQTPNLKPDLFERTVEIHLRSKIKEIYFNNN